MSPFVNVLISFFYLLIGLLILLFFRMLILAFVFPVHAILWDEARELKVWITASSVVLLVLMWRLSMYENVITPSKRPPADTQLLFLSQERMWYDLGLFVIVVTYAMCKILRIVGGELPIARPRMVAWW